MSNFLLSPLKVRVYCRLLLCSAGNTLQSVTPASLNSLSRAQSTTPVFKVPSVCLLLCCSTSPLSCGSPINSQTDFPMCCKQGFVMAAPLDETLGCFTPQGPLSLRPIPLRNTNQRKHAEKDPTV